MVVGHELVRDWILVVLFRALAEQAHQAPKSQPHQNYAAPLSDFRDNYPEYLISSKINPDY